VLEFARLSAGLKLVVVFSVCGFVLSFKCWDDQSVGIKFFNSRKVHICSTSQPMAGAHITRSICYQILKITACMNKTRFLVGNIV
jgi:hypothetical protein